MTRSGWVEAGVLSDKDEVFGINRQGQMSPRAVEFRGRDPDQLCGIIGVPARASIVSKELLLNIAKDVLHIAVVVSEPFLVAYDLGTLRNSIIVDIGAGTVDICGVKGMLPGEEDQVELHISLPRL